MGGGAERRGVPKGEKRKRGENEGKKGAIKNKRGKKEEKNRMEKREKKRPNGAPTCKEGKKN